MKRQWDIEELIERFTLMEEDEDLLANKTGATRLGFALLLKCFQLEGKFPAAKHEVPKDVVNYVAHQLKLEGSLFAHYDWEGRTIKFLRAQIREHYHFREATVVDTEEMATWLISTTLAAEQQMEHLQAKVIERFRSCLIEPPTPERIERLIQNACVTYEQQLFASVLRRLPQTARDQLDGLLETEAEEAEQDEEDVSLPLEERPQVVRWRHLKA